MRSGHKQILIFLLFFVSFTGIYGQETDSIAQQKEKKWSLHGYVKDMVTFNFSADSIMADNLIHNRLNFKWYPNDKFTFHLEVRNRIFFGSMVKAIPNYGDFIDTNNDFFDLSALPVNKNNFILHTMIDRAYVQYTKDKWEFRLGRQRINWGTNIVWNPNDLFNAYSFFDFDYEERPGSDAIRITRYNNFASSIELAAKIASDIDSTVIAMLYKFNVSQYDIQFIGGVANGDYSVGVGWAGNLKNVGFKGEMTYFTPYENRPASYNAFVASAGLDYSFPNSLYVMGSWLYNSAANNQFSSQENFLMSPNRLSSKNLMPIKNSAFVQASYPVHPLVNAGLSLMTFPGDNAVFINPSVSISIRENFDLGFFGQLFFNEKLNGNYGSAASLLFMRAKWSM
ncbi:MAG: hypothetical protein OEW75_15725 [Cyclobacteriaceae bacterium]|nr:hypothetical protein [Cyclobacteriaceae bacterium]